MKSNLQAFLSEKNLDCIIVTGASAYNPFMTYFVPGTFFTRAMIVLIKGEEPVLLYRPMERDTAAKTSLREICFDEFPMKEFLAKAKGNSLIAEAHELKAILTSLGLNEGRIAFCGKLEFGRQFAVVRAFSELAPEYEIMTMEGADCLENCRYTKDKDELESIRTMGERVVTVVGKIEAYIRSCILVDNQLCAADGKFVTIGQIKEKINLLLSEAGGENPQGTIFAMGRDAGVPHNDGNDAAILEGGKTIVFDFFPCEAGGGYFYDFTRTWCIGYASETVQKAYDQVKQVHHEIINAIEPGMPVKALQQKTCELFQEMGHPTVMSDPKTLQGYVHSVSHGLGINVHERPFSGFGGLDSDVIEPGVVFTVEPGLYYPEAVEPFGIRIEDTIYIDTDGKPHVFAQYPYELVVPVNQAREVSCNGNA